MQSTPRFLQGVYGFVGKGIDTPVPLDAALTYTVPDGVVAQPVYFRAGNTTGELVYVLLTRDGKAMRYFPVGARGDVHVPLRVVEDLAAGTVIELLVGAPDGLIGSLVLDLGLVEV